MCSGSFNLEYEGDENIIYQKGRKYGRYMRLEVEVWEKFAGLGGMNSRDCLRCSQTTSFTLDTLARTSVI